MQLAKPCIDVALYTSSLERVEPFWRDEVGLDFDHVLRLDHDGVRWNQHRYRSGQSIIKINDRPATPKPASGYRQLLIARKGLSTPRALTDPDGNRVQLVPPGYHGVNGIGLQLSVRDLAAHEDFYENIGLVRTGPGAYQAGSSMLLLERGETADIDQPLFAPGWRYITFQVFDANTEHAHFLKAGALAGLPVIQLRDVVRAAMVRDPDGNWIELSQRASIVGPLDCAAACDPGEQ